MSLKTSAWLTILLGGLIACTGEQGPPGNNGTNGTPGDNALASTSDEPPGDNCPSGGTRIDVGVDANRNGALEPAEITSTTYVCSGDSGHDSLVATTVEPPGANCPFGGTRIDTSVDVNDDGVLDPGEVDADATSYV